MTSILPVAIMSFDRPDYLEAVLQSVVRQTYSGPRELKYFLFQDGVVGRTDGKSYGQSTAVDECVKVFKAYFPQSEVHSAVYNLGVAANFDRAERYSFEYMKASAAIFLEDDMILQPHYLSLISRMLDMAEEYQYIGMVSAYGASNDISLEDQCRLKGELCLMNEHNWAFAITRACWEKRDLIVKEYLQIMDDIEYRDRKSVHPEIEAMLRRYGRGGKGYLSSQDSIKNMACEVLGFHRVSTFTNNARYIGRKGLHMTTERFFQRGYHRTVLFPEDHGPFRVPSESELIALRAKVA